MDPIGELLCVRTALITAQTETLSNQSEIQKQPRNPGEVNRNRSKAFIRSLTHALRSYYPPHEKSRRVLSRANSEHRAEFGLNELLYDILVCDIAKLTDISGYYVTQARWQIESELSRDAKQVAFDFNKLVLGNAPFKLLIASQKSDTDRDERFLNLLLPVAHACRPSAIYAALIPHPSEWENGSHDVSYWRPTETYWERFLI